MVPQAETEQEEEWDLAVLQEEEEADLLVVVFVDGEVDQVEDFEVEGVEDSEDNKFINYPSDIQVSSMFCERNYKNIGMCTNLGTKHEYMLAVLWQGKTFQL